MNSVQAEAQADRETMRSSRVSLAKRGDPVFQPLDRDSRSKRDRRGPNASSSRAAHQQAALLAGVIGEAVGEAAQRIRLPGRKIAPGLHHAARGAATVAG